MKNTVLRVMLALVITLTLVIGSVSPVSAKGKPQPTLSIEILDVNYLAQPYYTIHYHYSWANYKVYRADVRIIDTTIDETVYLQVRYKLRRKLEGTPTVAVHYSQHPGTNVTNNFSITLTITDRKGNLLTTTSNWTSS